MSVILEWYLVLIMFSVENAIFATVCGAKYRHSVDTEKSTGTVCSKRVVGSQTPCHIYPLVVKFSLLSKCGHILDQKGILNEQEDIISLESLKRLLMFPICF